jgi:cyanate permease
MSPANLIGRVIGYQNTIANAAGICAPILTGVLVDRTNNFDAAIVFAAASLLTAAVIVLFLIRQSDVDKLHAASQ